MTPSELIGLVLIIGFGKRAVAPWESVCSWCNGSSDQSFMVDPLGYFSIQPVCHNFCNHGMYYPFWDSAYKRSLAAMKVHDIPVMENWLDRKTST